MISRGGHLLPVAAACLATAIGLLDCVSATAQPGASRVASGRPVSLAFFTNADSAPAAVPAPTAAPALASAASPVSEGPVSLALFEKADPADRAAASIRTYDSFTPAEIQRNWFKPLDQVRAEMSPPQGLMPSDCSAQLLSSREAPAAAHPWRCIPFQWAAPEMAFQPLYFDDVPLERYGQTIRPIFQPVLSAARFYAAFVCLPYKIGCDLPGDSIYTLGYYRPGDLVPGMRQGLR